MKITVSERSRSYARRRVQDHMSSTVFIYKDGDIAFDPDTGLMSTPVRDYYYYGKARVASLAQSGTMLMGEISMSLGTASISIPFSEDVHPKRDDVVVVSDNPTDQTADDHKFRVMSVNRGGIFGAVITMECVSFEDSAQWKYS